MNSVWSRIIEPTGIQITPDQIVDFETELGFKLPTDYSRFLLSINGGKIVVEHDIPVPELSCDVVVYSLLPFTEPSPFLGVKEARDIAVKNRFALKHVIEIGSDGGTGFYLLVLDGPQTGAVYFGWKEDVFGSKNTPVCPESNIPLDFVKISSDFDSLAEIILANSTWSSSADV